VAVAAVAVLLAACGSDDEESSAVTNDAGRESAGVIEAPAVDEAYAPAATDAPAATNAATEATNAAPVFDVGTAANIDITPDQFLVVEVTARYEVADVAASVSKTVELMARFDGQVYGSDVQLSDPETATARFVIKLPPANVEDAIVAMESIGRLIVRTQNTDNVTDTMLDINTRIISEQQSVDRMQALLAEAKDLGEVVMLEGELTARQTVLEQLLAQQRNLSNQTALATLTIELTTPPVKAEVDVVDDAVTEDEDETIGDAFAKGGRAFVVAASGFLIFIGYVAPFLAIGLVLLGVASLITRRRARRNRSAALPRPQAPVAGPQTTERDSVGAAKN
jgi:Domain of unknown function (DUF4349)